MLGKHLLSAGDLDRAQALMILDTTAELASVTERSVKKLPTLRGRTVVNLFFEDSTRTRLSFELAAKRLSADVITFSAKGSSVSKGESLKDTALTLEAMGADAVIVRHGASGAPYRLATAGWIDGSVINAGDGTHEHPTQALLDAFSMTERLGDVRGKNIAIVGDIRHSRVAISNILCLQLLGANVRVCGPKTLIPKHMASMGVEVSHDLDETLAWCDVANMLRIQLERQDEHAVPYFPTLREYAAGFGLDKARLDRLDKEITIMHPGPINRGVEITSAVADSDHAIILDQVENGVAVRMAVLYLLASNK